MIHDGDYDRNADTDEILSLLAERDAEYCMNMLSKFHIREFYVLKYQGNDPDTPTYMEALLSENAKEYLNAMDDKIQSFMRRETWEIVSRKSVADQNVIPRTWYFKCKRENDWTIRKFKARYCVRGDVQKILFTKPLNLYSPVVQWYTVRLMLIFQCILGL